MRLNSPNSIPSSDTAAGVVLRRFPGWSQARLAEHVGVSQSVISRIDRGVQAMPRPIGKLLDQLEAELSLPSCFTDRIPS